MDRLDTEVLVVGAGPVGMVVALELAARGVRVAIVDKYQRTALHSYALVLHPQSLRSLDELGVMSRLADRGQPVSLLTLHDGASRLAEIDLSAVGGAFPFVLVIPQFLLEGALEARLAQAGVSVLWGHQLLAFETCGETVSAVIARVGPEAEASDSEDVRGVSALRIQAHFLVGADGAESLTRRLLAIEQDAVGEPMDYALIEFEASLDAPDRGDLILREESTDVLWPLGPDRARWGVQLTDGVAPDRAGLTSLIRERAPWFRTELGPVHWITTVRFQPRMAQRFGRGRIWLAGDAAHGTSPIGVHSMNVGLREGRDLARRIAEVLHGRCSEKTLAYYNEERNREWKGLLGLKDMVGARAESPDWARRLRGRLVASLPSSRQDLNLLLKQVGLRLDWTRRRQAGSVHGTSHDETEVCQDV